MNWLNIIDKVKANCCNSVRLTTGNYRYSHTNRYNNAFIYFDCETLCCNRGCGEDPGHGNRIRLGNTLSRGDEGASLS